ncbi:MAG TPA: glutamine--fructose-6-phosphate transaminase (isomerizing) [Candidatus Baltobacteraceae bacterium]|nr:glutamine--fructose-6-phosphate transaminase (isomerizing) [Candidatus Baltobacteraceae bacterium]
MCGIVGYIGKRPALPILIRGLRSLEYRGYDSAGVAFPDSDAVKVIKAPGRIDKLVERVDGAGEHHATAGIAHTRWATHGAPTEDNAHPHMDCTGKIALVHNGIIENFSELKLWLEKSGHRFVSETDTEVLAHLVEEYHEGDLVAAVRASLRHLRGTYGIAVIHADDPGVIVAARLGSPIVIGVGEGEMLVASDPSALIGTTRKVIYLDDGEIARLDASGAQVTTLAAAAVDKETRVIEWTEKQIEKGGHAHFMLKEMLEQPETVRAALRGRISGDGRVQLGVFNDLRAALKDMRRIQIVACGSAYYAGLVGAQMIERLARIPVSVDLASEYRYREPVMPHRTAVLAVSQSGETADTLAALRLAKEAGLLTMGIVNVVGSTIARDVAAGIYNHAGPEIGVASTKAFVSQLTVFLLFALALACERGFPAEEAKKIAAALEALPGQIGEVLKLRPRLAEWAGKIGLAGHVMYLGRTLHHPIALEGALKLKEVSYIHAEGYASGEMKHGPIAMIEPGFPIVALAPRDAVFEKVKSNLEEVRARGAVTFVVTTSGGAKELGRMGDSAIEIPETHPLVQPILSVIPLQLLAYETAVAKGFDVDKPRNLAKSVTVE